MSEADIEYRGHFIDVQSHESDGKQWRPKAVVSIYHGGVLHQKTVAAPIEVLSDSETAADTYSLGSSTVNMDAETNPKAKTITTIRYVHRKRISERFSGTCDETVAEKVDDSALLWACCVKTASPAGKRSALRLLRYLEPPRPLHEPLPRPRCYSPEQGDLFEQPASAVRDTGERIVADRDREIRRFV